MPVLSRARSDCPWIPFVCQFWHVLGWPRSLFAMKQEYEHEDDAQLAAMGHQPELKRNFSTL